MLWIIKKNQFTAPVYVPKINEYLKACGFNPDNNPHFEKCWVIYTKTRQIDLKIWLNLYVL